MLMACDPRVALRGELPQRQRRVEVGAEQLFDEEGVAALDLATVRRPIGCRGGQDDARVARQLGDERARVAGRQQHDRRRVAQRLERLREFARGQRRDLFLCDVDADHLAVPVARNEHNDDIAGARLRRNAAQRFGKRAGRRERVAQHPAPRRVAVLVAQHRPAQTGEHLGHQLEVALERGRRRVHRKAGEPEAPPDRRARKLLRDFVLAQCERIARRAGLGT